VKVLDEVKECHGSWIREVLRVREFLMCLDVLSLSRPFQTKTPRRGKGE
jgi:hypothetical protein